MPSRSATGRCELPGSSLSATDVFVYQNGTARVSVSGNPNMSNVQSNNDRGQKSHKNTEQIYR